MALKRKSDLRAKKPMKRGGKIKPKKRKLSEFQRVYGSKERVAFVKSLPCVVPGCQDRRIQNCHSRSGGTGRKADYFWIYPGCEKHHAEEHKIGRKTFEKRYQIDLNFESYWTNVRWKAHKGDT